MKLLVQINPHMDRILFTYFKGIYDPNFRRVRDNLHSGEEEIRAYLGTYFPRSFAEQRVIWARLLSNPKLIAAWDKKERIRILDIGSGTGGNVQGILDVLMFSPLYSKSVEVWAIDGNKLALEYQEAISESLAYCGVRWNFITRHLSLNSKDFFVDLTNIHREIGSCGFDIIITSKFLSEIIGFAAGNKYSDSGFYKSFLLWGQEALNNDGLLVIVDVIVQHNGIYTNYRLCKEWHSATEYGFNLGCIFPRVCGQYQSECSQNKSGCRQVSTIRVKHSARENDIANICFKIFTQKELAQTILNEWGPIMEPTLLMPKYNWVCLKGRMQQGRYPNAISPFE